MLHEYIHKFNYNVIINREIYKISLGFGKNKMEQRKKEEIVE